MGRLVARSKKRSWLVVGMGNLPWDGRIANGAQMVSGF